MTTPRLTTLPPPSTGRRQRRQRRTRSFEVGPANPTSLTKIQSGRRSSRRLLQLGLSEQIGKRPSNLSPEDKAILLATYSEDDLRSFYGLHEDADISLVMDNIDILESLNSDSPARQDQLLQFTKENRNLLRNRALPRAEPSAVDQPLSNQDRADQALTRLGYGGSEAMGDLPIPEFDPKVEPTKGLSQRGAASIGKPIELIMEGINQSLDIVTAGPLIRKVLIMKGKEEEAELHKKKSEEVAQTFLKVVDVAESSVVQAGAELASQVPNLVTGDFGDLEVPTLFNEGVHASAEKFFERPFAEQIGLSLLVPVAGFTSGKIVLKGITGTVGKLTADQMAIELGRSKAQNFLRKLQDSGEVSLTPMYPENGNVLASAMGTGEQLLDEISKLPRKALIDKVPLVSQVRRAADPSSEIRRYAVGSPKRIALETDLLHKRLRVMGDAFVEVV